jgi:hypothetical protein
MAVSGIARVSEYAEECPRLVPEEFFSGALTAHGVVKNRSGKVFRRFRATINAHWQNGVGTLDEHFVFTDGEVTDRIWTLKPAGDSHYTGTAPDIVGAANLQVAGNSMFLDYVLRVPYRKGSIDLRLDDRMYLVSPNVLINESRMQKWGFTVGQVVLVMEKSEALQ